MTSVWPELERLLPRVRKPGRYIGGEGGCQRPQHGDGIVSWLLAYPDVYEVGLPNQGLQILYEILNERDDAAAERTYAPWVDLEAEMRAHGVPLFSVDTHRPAGEFHVLAFNLSSELVMTNVLNMIDLAGVPLHAAERTVEDPLVIVGGHAAFNPEPLADFIDAAVLGDGEEVIGELTETIGAAIAERDAQGLARDVLLHRLATIDGVYVPSMYEVTFAADDLDERGRPVPGGIIGLAPRREGVPPVVDKRTVADLADWPYPKQQLEPLIEVVHDRLNVEVFRGCTRGCRFCQAGMITRPVRERPPEQIRTMVAEGLRRSGHDQVSLTSLSTADLSDVGPVLDGILDDQRRGDDDPADCGVSISLPSLRVDAFTVGLAEQVTAGRRAGLTFAPEAGTWRLRQVINKLITDEDLEGAVDAAFAAGWTRLKLYFLIGLPSETDDDVAAIVDLAARCVERGRRHTPRASVTVSVGGFVPKAHTPFQWFGQNTTAELARKVELLRNAARKRRGVQVKWHDPDASTAEGIVSRGDRRIGAVIERVWRAGGVFQEWSEFLDLQRWTDALAAEGLSLDHAVHRHRGADEVFAWTHLSAGLFHDFLWDDWQAALAEAGLDDCRWTHCYDCGVCTGYDIDHVVASSTPPGPAAERDEPGVATPAISAVPVALGPTHVGAVSA